MTLLYALTAALGVGIAVGIRPFLPVLLLGACSHAKLGVNFQKTDVKFLGSWVFLAIILAVVVIIDMSRRRGETPTRAKYTLLSVAAISTAMAFLEGIGLSESHGSSIAIGLIGGLAGLALALGVVIPLFERVRRRLDMQAGSVLVLYADGLGLAICGLTLLFAPLAIVIAVALTWLWIAGRRNPDRKYAGLRILR